MKLVIRERFIICKKKLFKTNDDNPYELKDVVYLNKLTKEYYHKEKAFQNIKYEESDIVELSGCIKYNIWEFERETRLIIKPDGHKEIIDSDGNILIDSVFLRIDDELLADLNVTFNPWITNKMKEKLKKILDEMDISSGNSLYDGQIDL